jgi:hypothetical protein
MNLNFIKKLGKFMDSFVIKKKKQLNFVKVGFFFHFLTIDAGFQKIVILLHLFL